jgi:hypothetical protein
MNIPEILIIVGLISIVASFFIGNSSGKYSDELEKVSISLHQETSGLKKRLKAVEEELMISVGPMTAKGQQKPKTKPVHEIIINQIITLKSQGFSIEDIAKRSSLSSGEVISVLRSKGVL